MKAIICRSLGAPSILRLEEQPIQNISADDVRIKVRAAGINFPDILMVAGTYQHKPSLPFVPGFEIAGEIIEIGENCSAFKVGERVLASMRTGGYAEECVVNVTAIQHMPTSFNFAEGAAFQVAYSTAYVALVRRANLRKGETLLVHGAAGGVGLAAVQMGRVLGANVIAAVSTEEKMEPVFDAGANEAILLNQNGFRDQVKKLTDGNGANVIFDPVGGDIFDESLRCIAWGGRILVVGFASGRISHAPANRILIKGCSVIGVRAGEFSRRDPVRGQENYKIMLALANDGALKPRIHSRVPLAHASEGMDELTKRKVIGKIVLIP